MQTVLRGRVLKVGDSINTDVIAPGRWKGEGLDVLREHTFEALYPEFYKTVRQGDILIAGGDFGCGSHREQAVTIIKKLGMQAIVAESIARLYFRNSISLGLPAFSAKGICAITETNDLLEIAFSTEKTTIRNETNGASVELSPLPEEMLEILHAGGILPYLKNGLR